MNETNEANREEAPASQEAADAQKVEEARTALQTGDFALAGRLLMEVAANTPADYVDSFETEDSLLIKSWTLEEFAEDAVRLGNAKNKNVLWHLNAYPRAHFYMGFLLNHQGDYKGAMQWLNRAQELQPGYPPILMEMGHSLGMQGRHDAALALYERIVAQGEAVLPAMRATALRGMGFSCIELKDLDRADRCYQDSLALDPGNTMALQQRQYIASLKRGGRIGTPVSSVPQWEK